MLQGLDSEGLKSNCGHKDANSSWAAVDLEECDENCGSNFQAGAPWQEATELMKALEMLIGNALYKSRAGKQEMEQKIPKKDVLAAVPSLDSLATGSKSEAVEGQDHELPQQCELFHGKDALSNFTGHEGQGLDHQPAYLSELEVEDLVASSPVAKTLCDIKQALLNLQQSSELGNPDSKHETSLGSSALFSAAGFLGHKEE
ncbi:uncharacterized protein [Heliangelus exortis]|uniref:uncharacterized protein n=1 Tax=Heliangelus exortis TaxID=472823 RepID=UPI003A8CE74E